MVRKNLKKLIISAMLVIGVVSTSIVVSAATTESAWSESPASTAGKWSERTTAIRCYVADETAKGLAAYVKFDAQSFDILPGRFASSSGIPGNNTNRSIEVRLMELDENNADDLVKTYKGYFTTRKLTSIYISTTHMSGDIEATGDNGAELYIITKVDRLSGDPSTPSIASGLFNYKVGMTQN